MKKFKPVLLLLSSYLVIQVVLGVGIYLGWTIYYMLNHPGLSGEAIKAATPVWVSLGSIELSCLFTVLIGWRYKWLNLPSCLDVRRIDWKKAALPLALGVAWSATEFFVSDLSPISMDEETAKTFESAFKTPYGLLSVCLLGPVLEELMMREGVLGSMLRRNVNPCVAIALSALLFGAMHLNLCQFIFGTSGGVVLGIIYWKTRNIVLTTIVHVINNSVCVGIALWAGSTNQLDDQGALNQLYGGPVMDYVFAAVAFSLCAFLLTRYLRRDRMAEQLIPVQVTSH